MSRNIFVSKKNIHVQIITQSGRAELGMYAEDERGRVPTRCTAFIHNLRGQVVRGGWGRGSSMGCRGFQMWRGGSRSALHGASSERSHGSRSLSHPAAH